MAATTTITKVNIAKATISAVNGTPTIPSGTQIGDVVIFEVLVAAASAVPATPDGLTLIDSGSTTWSYATYYRVWTGTEPTITFSVSTVGIVYTRTYRGVSNANPIHVHSIKRNASTTTPSATSITTTIDGCMLVWGVGTGVGNATGFTDPDGFGNHDFFAGASHSSDSCDMIQSTAGATGALSGTWSGISSPTSYVSLIALKPAINWTTNSLTQNTTPDSYSWKCPPGVYGMDIEGWGAGGGGGGGDVETSRGGSGGGGGEYRKYSSCKTTPGTTYFIIVGKAGTGGLTVTAGWDGQGSAVINLDTGAIVFQANGGHGGGSDGAAAGAGGSGGTGGSTTHPGGSGYTANSNTARPGGGCGGPTGDGGNSDGTNGGAAGTGGYTGAGGTGSNVGGTPGGGGGGGAGATSSPGASGGPGAIRLTNPDRDPLGITFQLM